MIQFFNHHAFTVFPRIYSALRVFNFRKTTGKPDWEDGVTPDSLNEVSDDHDYQNWLRCANCRNPITKHVYHLEVQGNHHHRFSNPEGFVFNIRCFSNAPGCVNYGQSTLEHTWFAGYRWQIVLCGGCHIHIGWRYLGSDSVFYGLISDRLIEIESP